MDLADKLVWESTPCLSCGATDDAEVLKARNTGYRIVRCRRCAFAYLNPRPDEATVGLLYAADYECYQARPEMRATRLGRLTEYLGRIVRSKYYGYPPALSSRLESALATAAAPFVRPDSQSLTDLEYVGEGRMLDFGCGAGFFAEKMRQRGWNVVGMDFNEGTARAVAERYGFETFVGSLPHPQIKPASFDLITMGAVLEHVHHPRTVIAAACDALRPGGRLVISVPNFASWGAERCGQDWWGLFLPLHLSHFTPTTLREMVESLGMTVKLVDTPVRAGWLRRSFQIARKSDSPLGRSLFGRLARLRPVTSLIARWTGWIGRGDSLRLIAEKPAARPMSKAG